MRIVVFGASGRTGRRVVELALAAGHEVIGVSRRPRPARPGVIWRQADVASPDEVRTVVAGGEAVIVCLGPDGPDDAHLAAGTRHVIAAMHAHGIERIACVTGAMLGHPPDRLGWVLRGLRSSFHARSPAQAGDRRQQEQIVEDSGLRWTLVRPARLVDGARTPARVDAEAIVPSLATSRRDDVAAALLDAVTRDTHVGDGVVVLSRPPIDRAFVTRWAAAYGTGELLGLAVVGAGFAAAHTWAAGSLTVAVIVAVIAGIVEGAIVGGLLGVVLTAVRPEVRLRTWTLATITGAVIAWTLASIPTATAPADGGEPPSWLLLGAAAMGAAAGPVLALFQGRALRVAGVRAPTWIVSNAIGWAIAMPIIFVAAGDAWTSLSMVVRGAALLFVAGAIVGVVTGLALWLDDRTWARSPLFRRPRRAVAH